MEPKFQTSFIPKKPIDTSVSLRRRGAVGMFTFISILVFVFTLVAAGGVFAWSNYLKDAISQKYEKIVEAKKQLDNSLTSEIFRLDSKLKISSMLIAGHLSPSVIFPAIQKMTLLNVRFYDFVFSSNNDSVVLTMKGLAKDFSTIALQSASLSDPKKNNIFENPIFSDFKLDENGNVNFVLTTSLKPSGISYKNKVTANADAPKNKILNTGAGITASSTQARSSTTDFGDRKLIF